MRSIRSVYTFGLIFAAGIALGASIPSLGATLLGSTQFPDIQPGSYYDAPVGRLAGQGVIKGGADGKFHPGDFVTRADVAVMIDRAVNGSDSASTSTSVSSRARASSSSVAASVSSVASSPDAGTIRFTTDGFNVAKGAKRATVSLVRTGGSKGEVKVDYAFGGGTAIAGTDYAISTGTMTFAAGETTKSITVTLMRSEDSPQRTLEVTLSNVSGGAALGTPSKLTLTLLGGASSTSSAGTNASAAAGVGSVQFSANTYAVLENGGAITITVKRTGGSNNQVTVNYATSNGTATAGAQYTAAQGTLTFASGETSKSFSVQVTDNADIGGNKTVNLTLSTPTGGVGITSPSSAVLTIVDEEALPASGTGSVQFSSPTYTVDESSGVAVITVQRLLSYTGTVNVNYATADGTAIAGSDYTITSGTLTFAPGETSKTFSIPITKDSNNESEEMINLSLSSLTGPAILGTQSIATVKIQ